MEQKQTELAPASPATVRIALADIQERLSAIRVKADTNKRPDMGREADAALGRVTQLLDELEKPNAEFQNIERNVTELFEDTNVLERKAGTAPR